MVKVLVNNTKSLLSLAAISVLVASLIFASMIPSVLSQQQPPSSMPMQQQMRAMAFGYIANNQYRTEQLLWIQGGIWRMNLLNAAGEDNNTATTGIFSASFTMVKPGGSAMHKHSIKNFTSDMVTLQAGDVIMTGVGDIYSGEDLKYPQVPITVHLMGKNVLGLIIDVNKTESHFASSNEFYGIVIRSNGIDAMMPQDGGGMNMTGGMDMNMTGSNTSTAFDFTGVGVTDVTANSAIVEGTTTMPVNCQVEYGSSADKMDQVASDNDMMMSRPHQNHSVMLKNLEPDTTYSYRFKATVNSETVYSEIKTFTTTSG